MWKTPWKYPLAADACGRFLERPNRFLARVELEGKIIEVHVHDPGRLPQVLVPGTPVLIKYRPGPKRRTSWDLLAGKAAGHWVFAHSGYHRPLTQTLLSERGPDIFPGLKAFKPEPQVNKGRLDYLLELEKGDRMFVEIKGCTLAEGQKALFPDAPTSRGRKHLQVLTELKKQGIKALVWLLVFRPECTCFAPAEGIDPLFTRDFYEALEVGVEPKIFQFSYDGRFLRLEKALPLCEVS